MKKPRVILGVLAFLLIFACTLPSTIEITGTPSFEIAVNMNFADLFSDILDSVFGYGYDDIVIQECTHNSLQFKTFLIAMEVANYDLDVDFEHPEYGELPEIIFDYMPIEIDFGNYEGEFVLLEDVEVYTSDQPTEILFSSFGENMPGFIFNTDPANGFPVIVPKLYITGSSIVSVLTIELSITTLGDDPVEERIPLAYSSNRIEPLASGIDKNSNVFTGAELPPGGLALPQILPYLIAQKDVEIRFHVQLDKGETISLDCLEDANIQIELVIWFPLILVAYPPDGENAEFILSGFEDIGVILSDIASVGIIQSINLAIEMNYNPFRDGVMFIKSDGFIIENPMTPTTLVFAFTEEEIDFISNNDFNPEFSIVFEKGAILGIPQELRIMTIALDAKIAYTVETDL